MLNTEQVEILRENLMAIWNFKHQYQDGRVQEILSHTSFDCFLIYESLNGQWDHLAHSERFDNDISEILNVGNVVLNATTLELGIVTRLQGNSPWVLYKNEEIVEDFFKMIKIDID